MYMIRSSSELVLRSPVPSSMTIPALCVILQAVVLRKCGTEMENGR